MGRKLARRSRRCLTTTDSEVELEGGKMRRPEGIFDEAGHPYRPGGLLKATPESESRLKAGEAEMKQREEGRLETAPSAYRTRCE